MRVLILLVALGVNMVLGQSGHATASFGYQGCASVDMSCFTSPAPLNGSPLTPESCQQACQGHRFAALFPNECRCGDDANAIKPLDEGACNHACNADASYGMCGGICPAEGPGIANVYGKPEAVSQQPQVQTTDTLAPPVTSTAPEPCTSSEPSPAAVATKQPGGVVSPFGIPPEVPTTFTFLLTSSTPGTSVAVGTMPSPPAASTTPCPLEASSTPEQPAVVTVPPQTTTCDESSTSFITSTTSPETVASAEPTTAAPPQYSSKAPEPSAQSYSDDYMSGQQATDTANSTYEPTPGASDYSSTSTPWSRPSDTADPTGQPSAPAQVPGSDSTHSMVPPLATIGGLALIAAIIM
ncbi:Twinfilin-1 [Conoideocrella luteorostrata]|uniref:Twinfilin-1 n=1 Tax=Conoideocrella luteorostrata TaxID=1105319 RepID=A0AAJ0CP29_9HYPO|nr:Twinfilin-1 [Conoideocrella luteorostrata]